MRSSNMMGITVSCPSYGKAAQLGSVGQLWKTRMSLLLHAMFSAALDAQENRVLMLPGLHGSVALLMGFLLFFLHPIVNGVAARYGLKIL
jgi:hypothetical protein